MKLYMHPVSTTSRPVMQFIADNNIAADMQVVDILKGEHYEPAYSKINPNHLIPMLEDGDFRLTESAAILRYLAEKTGSPAYPKDLKQRARVNEVLDWFNSNFYRDWGYGLIYPQLFPHLKREDAKVQEAVIAWGKDKSKAWLQVLNDHFIGPKNQYLCGDEITIADYFGAALVTAGELVHCNLSAYPNVERWLANVKKRPSYAKVYETFNGFCASTKGQPWQAIPEQEVPMIKGLHHNAYRCRDSEETRKFYEEFLGLPLVNAFAIETTMTGRKTGAGVLHSFFQLDDGSCLAFFEAPDMPFEFKEQHDFDLHIALEVEPDALDKMLAKGKAEGREVRGISDHKFIRSIYFRDPNGYVIELTAKIAGKERDMDPKQNHARDILNKWQVTKTKPAKAA